VQLKYKSVKLDVISWITDKKCYVRLAHSSIAPVCDKGKGTAISVLAYCRPERVPGGWGSQISRHLAHKVGQVVSLTYPPCFPPGNIPGTRFRRGWSEPRAIAQPARLCEWNIFLTPSGIKMQPACSAVWTNCTTVCSTVCDNIGRIKNRVLSGSNLFVCQDYHRLLGMNHAKNYGFEYLISLLH